MLNPRHLKSSFSIVTRHHRLLLQRFHGKAWRGKADQAQFDFGKKEGDDGERLHLYKEWGQHLLTNNRILDTIVSKSIIRPSDTVLEIGPGTGNLTLKLLEAAHKVVAVEIDERMADFLQKRVDEAGLGDKLTVICKDALKTEFPQFDLVVANIPYGISSPLIAKLLFGPHSFRTATLLLQKEYARRLMADPGDSDFNRLAVNVQLVANVELVMHVSKREFVPNPKVDSSVVTLHPKPEIPDVDLNEWRAFTLTCFRRRNKTLGATFKQKRKLIQLMRLSSNEKRDVDKEEMGSFREKVIGVLRSSGFEDKRPSKLGFEELLRLLSLLNQEKIYFHKKGSPSMEICDSCEEV